MKQILVIQHVPFEGPAMIGQWAEEKGWQLQSVFPETEDLSRFGEPAADLVVLTGGPMNVDETERYPWLADEAGWLRRQIESGCRVFGICLGAQMIAKALGARVYPAGCKEIGWAPVQWNDNVKRLLNTGIENNHTVLHWHGDTFDLPDGATLLASTKRVRNQAFLYKENVAGFQFHIEMDQPAVASILTACIHETADVYKPAPCDFVQGST